MLKHEGMKVGGKKFPGRGKFKEDGSREEMDRHFREIQGQPTEGNCRETVQTPNRELGKVFSSQMMLRQTRK